MPYQIAEHVEHQGSRILVVLVNPEVGEPEEGQPDQRVYRRFVWGMDVEWEAVVRETTASLDEEFAASKHLGGVGDELR